MKSDGAKAKRSCNLQAELIMWKEFNKMKKSVEKKSAEATGLRETLRGMKTALKAKKNELKSNKKELDRVVAEMLNLAGTERILRETLFPPPPFPFDD